MQHKISFVDIISLLLSSHPQSIFGAVLFLQQNHEDETELMYKVSHEMTLSKCDTTAHLSSHPYECRPNVCEHLCSAHTHLHAHTQERQAHAFCRHAVVTARFLRVETSKTSSSLLLILSSWCMCGYTFFIWHTPAAACVSLIYAAHKTAQCVFAYRRCADVQSL